MGKKVFPIFPARVEKIGKVWYNHRMNTKTPDLAACKALIEQNAPRFRLFFDILTAYNARFNLTAITKEEEVFHKHFLDSVAGAFLLPAGAAVTEVGSGAGFPSIPLKLVRDDLTFTLIESTGKKCDFLREACRALGLTGMEVLHTRAEDAARTPLRERSDVCIARAVAPLPSLAEYCLPFVRVGGSFIAWKGGADEVPLARRALSLLGGGEPDVYRYDLPDGSGARTLVAIPKKKHTPAQYPRGNGRERKNPL